MRAGARQLRPVAAVSIVGIVFALAGCGAAALPPPPPATATVSAVATAAISPTAQTTAASTAVSGNAAQIAAGKAAFTTTCGSCHMLSSAGTSGSVGPSLNGIGSARAEAWIVAQIQNPCASGHADAAGPKYNCSSMPPGIAQGAQAQAIAAYLASQK
jgi:mono/diheme cytochrome c family protein